MWQICGHVPQSLLTQTDVTCAATQLSVSFFMETFIHSKEKVCKLFIIYKYLYYNYILFYISQQW